MPRLLQCLAATALLLVASGAPAQPPAAAPQPPAAAATPLDRLFGQPIVEVRFVLGGKELQDVDLRQVLETQPGTPLTAAAVRESIVHLMALARFDAVEADAESGPSGVVLVYRLTAPESVKDVEFRGDLGVGAKELRAAVKERYGGSPAAARADEVSGTLEALLRDKGFLKASVRWHAETLGKAEEIALVFDVSAGVAALVGKATVEGESGGSADEVLRRLGVRAGSHFDRQALEDAVARYLDELRGLGYLEARMEPELAYDVERGLVDIVVRMKRGPHVSIAIRGDGLPEKRQAQILARLTEGALDEDALENAQSSIEDDLRARGFRDATAPFKLEPRGDAQVLVVFAVTPGPQYKTAGIELAGNQQLTRGQILPVLRVEPAQWFVQARVDADAKAVEDLYRKQGFRAATVAVTTAPLAGDPTQLLSTFTIAEGSRTTIASIEFAGVSSLPRSVLEQAIQVRAGGPFSQVQTEADREAVLYHYQSLGYQQAAVTVPMAFNQDGTRIALRFEIEEGPRSYLDHVLVVGNARTKTSTIERALALKPGEPLSFEALAEAQRRVSALGLFRRVQLTPLERNTGNRRDLLVTVEESPVHTIGYGGGLEGSYRARINAATGLPEDKLDLAPRGFIELGRRNLWGKNRAVSFFARGAIRTSDQFNTDEAPPGSEPLEDTGAGFREYRVMGTYREPRFLNLPVDLLVAAAVDQAIRSTFDFNRRQVNAEVSHRFSQGFTVAGRYLFGHTRLFNERIDPDSQLNVDRVFPTVRLSTFSGALVVNTRDDAFEPTRGYLTAFDMTFAPRAIGSEVGFIKASWQGFAYRQVPKTGGLVLAVGARVGLARGAQQIALDPEGRPTLINQELPASERFFAGGDTTVRGWALDRLGSESVLDANGLSNGGNGLLIFNGELRFPFWKRRSLGGAVFIDVGNVFAKVGDIDFGELRSGAGFGIRWRSPVGPLRMDFAWKLHPITFQNGQPENHFAWYVTIGQAF